MGTEPTCYTFKAMLDEDQLPNESLGRARIMYRYFSPPKLSAQ